jgi:hypothetical protein
MNVIDDEDDDDMAEKDDEVSEELTSRYSRTFLPIELCMAHSEGVIFPFIL